MTALRLFKAVPAGLARAEPQDLCELLGGPALLHLQDDASRSRKLPGTLFVSVLLHGNEPSGWLAVRRLLREQPALPRDLLLFIGNVEAAAQGVRALPEQPDFNRIWREPPAFAQEVLSRAADTPLLAVVDLHNNTGDNPHYGVLTDFSSGSRGLAALFSRTAVYMEEPATTLTKAFAPHTPNLALELGPVGDAKAVERGYEFLRALLAMENVPKPDDANLRIFRTLARVHLRPGVRFRFSGFSEQGAPTTPADCQRGASGNTNAPKAANPIKSPDLTLDKAIEASNFAKLPAGTQFGAAANREVLQVIDNSHQTVTDQFFDCQNGRIVLRQTVVPAMYTTDPKAAMNDCLCYFMAPLQAHQGREW